MNLESPAFLAVSDDITTEYRNKTLAITEVLLIYSAVTGLLWYQTLIPGFEAFQEHYLGKTLLNAFLGMALPGMILFYLHGTSTKGQIFNPMMAVDALGVGGKSLLAMVPATFAFPLMQAWGWNYTDWAGASVVAFFYLIAALAVLWILKKESVIRETPFSKFDARFASWVFIGGLILIVVFHQTSGMIRDILIALIYIGFLEEFFYRGYIQSRLNMAFGKPFTVLGFHFGWGLLITSALFGLAHVITPGNPLLWSWGFWTFFAGIGFGIIREKGGSFLASAMVHGITMIFPVVFS